MPRAANSKALGHPEPATEPLQFVPVALAAAPVAPGVDQAAAAAPTIDIELTRGATRLTVRWPVSEASACAAWLRRVAARFK